jgi:ABC-type transporter Mla MlaB component
MTEDGAGSDVGVLRIISSCDPPGLVIDGEIDESTHLVLVRAVRERARGLAEIHFWLGGVSYCDVAGLRAIVSLTTGHGVPGGVYRRVILHEVPPRLVTVLRLVGWDVVPGLTLAGRGHGASEVAVESASR